MNEGSEELIVEYIRTFSVDLLLRPKILRILESMITGFHHSVLAFVFQFIAENFMTLVSIRSGFFLIRKLIQTTKNQNIQLRIVELIEANLERFVSSVNGSLLSQSVIRNYGLRDRDEMFKNTFSDKLRKNLNSMKASKLNEDKYFSCASPEKLEDLMDELDVHTNTDENKLYSCNALNWFYWIIIEKILPLTINKHASKVLEAALKFGGENFHKKLLEKLFDTKLVKGKHYSILIRLLNSVRGTKFIKEALNLMKHSNACNLYFNLKKQTYILKDDEHKKVKQLIEQFKHLDLSDQHKANNEIKQDSSCDFITKRTDYPGTSNTYCGSGQTKQSGKFVHLFNCQTYDNSRNFKLNSFVYSDLNGNSRGQGEMGDYSSVLHKPLHFGREALNPYYNWNCSTILQYPTSKLTRPTSRFGFTQDQS